MPENYPEESIQYLKYIGLLPITLYSWGSSIRQ